MDRYFGYSINHSSPLARTHLCMLQVECDQCTRHMWNMTFVGLSGETGGLEIVHGEQELNRANVGFSDNISGLFHWIRR